MRLQPKNILCPTDLSEYSNHALDYAVALARKFQAKVHVCYTVDLSAAALNDAAAFVLPQARKDLLERARVEIDSLMAKRRVEYQTLLLDGEPSTEIARAATTVSADFVVCATHARSGWERWFAGSVTERLLHSIQCPLLVVHSPEHEFLTDEGRLRIRRVLLGYDFSPNSRDALATALSMAEEFQSELHLLHVLEPSIYQSLTKATGEISQALDDAVRGAVEEKLSALVPRIDHPWCEPKTAVAYGLPHVEIEAYASLKEVDLIVLGVRGLTLLDKVLLGSTTDRVLRHAPCPLLIVPPSATQES